MPPAELSRAFEHGFEESPSFPFVRHLEAHHAEVRAEAAALGPQAWADWPDPGSYSHGWKVFGLVSVDSGNTLAWTCPGNAARCPRTVALLGRIPGLLRAGFSMLLPGAHVYPHADDFEDRLRCHLALWTNPDAAIRLGERVLRWREGRCLVFQGHILHEAANLGCEHRVVCLLDIERSAAERELLP